MSYEESHRINNETLEKLCNRCKEWFPCTEEYFYNNSKSPDGLFPYCKECNKKRSTEWKREHPDRVKISMDKTNAKPDRKLQIKKSEDRRREEGKTLDWQRKNKDKCKEYNYQHQNHKISTSEWESCKKYFIHRCAYCGLKIEDHWVNVRGEIKLGDFHKEHVDHFGSNDLSNCVPSCKSCNSSKHKFLFEEWHPQQDFYSQEKYDKIIRWITKDFKRYISC